MNLTLTQKIYLLHKSDGLFFISDDNQKMYPVGAAMMELLIMNRINFNNGRVVLIDDCLTDYDYLNDLISFIKNNPNLKLFNLLTRYIFQKYDVLIKQVDDSLKLYDKPILPIVENLRAEALEEGEVSLDNQALILLIHTSNFDIRISSEYFSKFEQMALNKKVEDIKQLKNDATQDLVYISNQFRGNAGNLLQSLFYEIANIPFIRGGYARKLLYLVLIIGGVEILDSIILRFVFNSSDEASRYGFFSFISTLAVMVLFYEILPRLTGKKIYMIIGDVFFSSLLLGGLIWFLISLL